MRKHTFLSRENKGADQLRGNPTAAYHLCFHLDDSLYDMNPKLSNILLQYSLVCIRPGWTPQRLVFLRWAHMPFNIRPFFKRPIF